MKKEIFKDNVKITIIGTAHISKKSILEVQEIIHKEWPDVVGVELDYNRYLSMFSKNKRSIRFSDIFRTNKPFMFLTHYFLSKLQKKVAKRFNTEPGDEMKYAIISAKDVKANLLLLDRDVRITMQKLLKNLTFREKINVFFTGFKDRKKLKGINVNQILKEVESGENTEKLDKIMKIFLKRHKKLKNILIDQRDKYMAYQIQKIIQKEEINNMVVVVGAGHMNGLSKEIFNENINIKELVTI